MSKFYVAKSAGFCFGVSRSVRLAEGTLALAGAPCFSLGELIHNESVVAELSKKGLQVANTAEEVAQNSRVIIRSHGVAKSEYDKLLEKNAE
ncbi:MAG: bifunctional 4-hydroxy-3-methylbut-2-enyl diphosphate reductase/30S ribosomal protein S1, partial [Oscillospiraceae bacterium]